MTWSLAFPNLLVGLREGLEAGLVVTILIGAVRKLAPERSLAPVWLGVAFAAVLSLSFGAVLTFTRAEISPRAQEIFGGVTSLLAVVLVTSMVFWMRRAARGMAGELRDRIGVALTAGSTALVVTAFIAVAREGLEAALFVWTNAQAAGSSTSPLLGALVGLVIATAMCFGLYRRVLKIDLARFFRITGAALLVIVAGVLGYGVRDLQDAGVLPGNDAVAFDVSQHVHTGSWWTELIRGVTNLDNRMTWLQVGAYVLYLAIALPLFLRSPRTAAGPATTPVVAESAPPRRTGRWVAAALALVLPAAAAGIWVGLDSGRSEAHTTALTVTGTSCADGWAAPASGTTTYTVTNSSGRAVDVEVLVSATQAVVAEIEVLGPGTTRDLSATFAPGEYHWICRYAGLPATVSASQAVKAGAPGVSAPVALQPATGQELAPVLDRYRTYVAGQLALLVQQVARLSQDVARGDRTVAQQDWLPAHLTYHRIGAAYNAFGEDGDAVDGLAQGQPDGVQDAGFVGFHRIEYGLWHGAALPTLTAQARSLQTAVAALHAKLPSFTFDPNDVTIRAHEILEDTLRFTLTGQDDYGSGSGFATAQADLQGDRYLVGLLAPALNRRDDDLVPAAMRDMDQLQRTLASATGPVGTAPVAVRQRVNAATSGLLETLAPIPDLLEVRTP